LELLYQTAEASLLYLTVFGATLTLFVSTIAAVGWIATKLLRVIVRWLARALGV
jgi:hypothetical protein